MVIYPSDKLEKPDIEFQYKNATYVLDVTFAVEANICNAFKGKILKYGGTYGDNRVIPLVLRYNGTVYEKSMNLLTKRYLPEITDSFLSKHCCLAVARANEEAKLHYTSVITNENEVRLERPSSYRKKGTTRVLEQGKKAKPKATLDRTGSGQPSRIEDLEHERVRKIIQYVYNISGRLSAENLTQPEKIKYVIYQIRDQKNLQYNFVAMISQIMLTSLSYFLQQQFLQIMRN
ncbi:Putative_reverse transcriptase/endonuclease [Hexamita inflata]|uniref:Putative_reverse transcriptase/endonuclease n=1 Tax=Hexamita inflata TaxID=28002 RepID=A0ABP1HYE3_9EUKA